MILRLLVLLLLVLFSFGCRKGVSSFTIQGVIYDVSFNRPLDSTFVKLYKVPIGTGTEIIVDSIFLDETGTYSFTFEREKVAHYILKIQKENYFEIYDEIPFSNLTPSSIDYYNYETCAKSWVEMRFINTNVQSGDLLRFMKTSENSNCEDCCPGGMIDLYEQAYYSRTCVNNANSLFLIDYWVINGGNSQYGQKQCTPAPFDTCLIELNY